MHGALRRGLFASGFVGVSAFFLAVACSAPGADEQAGSQALGNAALARTPAKADVKSMLGKGTLRFSSKGASLVPVASAELATSDATPKLEMELPVIANGGLQLRPTSKPENSLRLTPALASKVSASLAGDGSAVYEHAFGSADLVQSATLDGLRTQIALRDADSPDLLAWQVSLGKGLRPVARDDLGTDLVDGKGDVWLSVSPVSIVDGHGNKNTSSLFFADDGFARLRVDHRGLAYPASVDFSITLGSVQALAITPTQIKGRVMVLLDTSGSMIWHFDDSNTTGGDSPPGQAIICDNALGAGSFACNSGAACTAANGGRPYWPVADAADPSRMLAAKSALQNVVNANAGILDFGLERYAESETCPNTTNPAYCCNSQVNGTTPGRCQLVAEYTDIPNTGNSNDLTYAGSCGTPYRGGRVLVTPGPASGTQLLPWVDFVEDFCSSTAAVGGPPRNPEIRGSGSTPLGRAVTTAREDWYRPVYTDSKTAGAQPLDDSLIDCRPYVLVVMTDGVDTCEAGTTHALDCAGSNAACNSGKCFDGNTGNNTDWRCSCTGNAQCPGLDTTCNLTVVTQDCQGNNAQCGAGSTCIDTPGNGDNWRCSCAADADCGGGMTCLTTTPPEVDCRDDDARCISNNCYDSQAGAGTAYRCACNGDAQCPASQRCDVANNRCVARGVCRAPGTCSVAEPLPRVQVQRLTAINATNPVKTYVLGMGDPAGLDTAELNAMAVQGGTAQARLANSQSEIEAAFADIVANTVKYEICNTADDNCNARIDEGLGVYQECVTGADCTGGATCNAGRCVCTSAAQCATGYTCSAESPIRFCRPSCSEGQGDCFVAGVRKCGVGVGQCCVDNNSATCTDIVPPTGTTEVCDGKDNNCNGFVDENLSCQGCIPLPEVCDNKDNDCDGQIDETGAGGLVDIGGPCGSSVGKCTPGTAVCTNGTLGCMGATGPFTEVCNGFDDDCDGVVDGMTQACYTGPNGTEGVGTCHGGQQVCTAVAMSNVATWGTCTGQQLPTTEICNGLDDDCDGTVDDGVVIGSMTAGADCCNPKATAGLCGVGQCNQGKFVCAGNTLTCDNAGAPSNETCDNIDNDCDGMIDNIPNLGGPCVAPGGCSGKLACDSSSQQLVCTPDGSAGVELCDGLDNDCDGKVDETDDLELNEPWWHDACDEPPAGHEEEPCTPGQLVCKNGEQVCEGAVGPLPEKCDLKDTDCDGVADTLAACPGDNACVQGVCVEPCRGGEFPCPGGYQCQAFGGKRYCVPTTCNAVECPPGASCKNGECTLDGSGGSSSNGGSSGTTGTTEGGDGSVIEGGNGATPEGGDNGGPVGGSQATGGNAGSSSSGNGSGNVGNNGNGTQGNYGVVTGGGGCACRTAPTSHGRTALLASLLLLGASFARRRRAANRRAA
jgi:MYXO-CTERM domain-containing protein